MLFLAKLSFPGRRPTTTRPSAGTAGVLVATASSADVPSGSGPRIIGFTTAGRARHAEIGGKRLAEGEVETLYVLDDWRERGVGRRLMRAAASHLVDIGCRVRLRVGVAGQSQPLVDHNIWVAGR